MYPRSLHQRVVPRRDRQRDQAHSGFGRTLYNRFARADDTLHT